MEGEEGKERPSCEFGVVFVSLCQWEAVGERNNTSLSTSLNSLGLGFAA